MIILLFSLYTIIRLAWDAIRIRQKAKTTGEAIQAPGYRNRNIVLAASMLVIAAISLLIDPTPPFWTRLTYQLGIFVLFFDYGINLLTGKKWYYISTTSKNRWEKLRAKTQFVHIELFIKLWLAACGISVYYMWELL